MFKHLITLALLCVTCTLSAQLQKGDRLVSLNQYLSISPELAPEAVASQYGGLAFYSGRGGSGIVYALPNYGFALSNRFVLGATAGLLMGIGGGGGFGAVVSPYVRYYPVNKANLRAFVGVGSNLVFDGSDVYGGEGVGFGGGLQLPISEGILFTPALNYNVTDGRNSVGLQATVEVTLGRNTRPEDKPVAAFQRGSFAFGAQNLLASFTDRGYELGLNLDGHYFLTDRLAAGLDLELGYGNVEFGTSVFNRSFVSTDYLVGLSLRYYLTTGRNLVWFAEVGGGYANSSVTLEAGADSSESSTNFASFSVAGGGQWFIRDNFAFEFGPNLTFTGENIVNRFGLTLGGRWFL